MAKKPKYLTDPETFNKEFERLVRLRDELKGRSKELEKLTTSLEDHKDLPEDVKENLERLKLEASNLESLLNTSQTYADSIETYYTNWSATKDKIDDELIQAQRQNKIIKELKTEGQELKDKLETELNRSSSLLEDARKTLEIVTNSSLSSVFKERSNDRRKARRWWSLAVALAIALFALSVLIAVFKLADDIKDQGSISVWIIKLALIAPFAYVLYFVTKQYTHERDLEEKYAFKSLVSQTIQNNTKLLRDEFLSGTTVQPDVELKIIDFVVESMRGIYKEPYSVTSIESRFKISPFKQSIEAQAKQSEQS
jgi:hypothetical protein